MSLAKRSAGVAWMCAVLGWGSACGGAATSGNTDQTTGSEPVTRRQPAQTPQDGLQVTGLLGTLSAMEVQRALEPLMPRVSLCLQRRYDALEILGGDIELSFRVATDGSVRWVYPSRSTMGDRATERCIVSAARRVRFPQPHGGEAEVMYPVSVDPPSDVRAPFPWPTTHVSEEVAAQRGSIGGCNGAASIQVTMYVAPGGRVVAAGASSSEPGTEEALDCVTEGVAEWSMPDPGSYPAKVTFSLD